MKFFDFSNFSNFGQPKRPGIIAAIVVAAVTVLAFLTKAYTSHPH
jgi:hypothetical protein